VLSFGIAQTVIRAGRQVRLRSDEIIIGAFRTVSVVTPYALVRRLSEAPLQLSDQLVDILLPLASQLHAQRDRVRLRELFIAGTRTAFAGYLLIGTSVALLASPFLRVWAGAAYAGHAAIAALLVCSGALAAGISPTEKVLASIGELKLPAAVSVASGVFKVGLAVVLIAEFGVIGVAVATLAAGVIDFIPLAIVGMRAAGVEVRAFLRDGLLPSLLCVASGAAGVVVARELAGDGSLATIVFDGAIGCFAFLIVYLLLPAAALERDLLARAIGRLKRRRRGSRRPAADSTELPPSA
jgi:O-antigen/teichoic acid export membrane protein